MEKSFTFSSDGTYSTSDTFNGRLMRATGRWSYSNGLLVLDIDGKGKTNTHREYRLLWLDNRTFDLRWSSDMAEASWWKDRAYLDVFADEGAPITVVRNMDAQYKPLGFVGVLNILVSIPTFLTIPLFEVRLDRISDLERWFLRAMADVRDRGGVELAMVADLLGRSVNSLSMVRCSLIRKGVIYSPRLGGVAYKVPLFGAYMKRVMN